MKKLGVIIVVLLFLSVAVVAGANSTPIKLFFNGEELVVGSSQIVEGKVFVPLDFLSERLGATVEWDQENNTVRIEAEEREDLKAQIGRLEEALRPEDPRAAAESWAEGVKLRNGALQYAVMAPELKKETYDYFNGLNWSTGVSSPWVDRYQVTENYRVDEDKYRFTVEFRYTDAVETSFSTKTYVTVENFDNQWLITALEQIEVSGKITEVTFDDKDKVKKIFVQGEAGAFGGYDQANVMIGEETKIYKGYTDTELTVDTLQKGVYVEVALTDDPRMMIYPVTAAAKSIRVFASSENDTIVYENNKYGFTFSLPTGWQNFQVLTADWEGTSLEEGQAGIVAAKGPLLKIRHPQWTEEEPWQDIPILVLTHKQWGDLQAAKFHIGAAPVGPRELGRNNKYVLALPARYNFAFPTGYEEVERIIESNPLHPFAQ